MPLSYQTLYQDLQDAAHTAHGIIQPAIYHKYLETLDHVNTKNKDKTGEQYWQDYFAVYKKLAGSTDDEKLDDHEKKFLAAARNHPNQRGLILLFGFLQSEKQFTIEEFIRICCDYHLIDAAHPVYHDEYVDEKETEQKEESFFRRLIKFINQHKTLKDQEKKSISHCCLRLDSILTKQLGKDYVKTWRYKYAELILGADFNSENVLRNIDSIIDFFEISLENGSVQADCAFDSFKKLIKLTTLSLSHCQQAVAELADNHKPIPAKIKAIKQHLEKQDPQIKILDLIKNIFRKIKTNSMELPLQHKIFTVLFMHIHEAPGIPEQEKELRDKIPVLIQKLVTEETDVYTNLRKLLIVFNHNHTYLIKAIDKAIKLYGKTEVDCEDGKYNVFPSLCWLIYFNFITEKLCELDHSVLYVKTPCYDLRFFNDTVKTIISTARMCKTSYISYVFAQINYYLIIQTVILSHQVRNLKIELMLTTWCLHGQLPYTSGLVSLHQNIIKIMMMSAIQRYAVVSATDDSVTPVIRPEAYSFSDEELKTGIKSYAKDMLKTVVATAPTLSDEQKAQILSVQQRLLNEELQALAELFKTPLKTEESCLALKKMLLKKYPSGIEYRLKAGQIYQLDQEEKQIISDVIKTPWTPDIGYKLVIIFEFRIISHSYMEFSKMDEQLNDEGTTATYKELAEILLSLIHNKMDRLGKSGFQLLEKYKDEACFGIKKIQYLFSELAYAEQLCAESRESAVPFETQQSQGTANVLSITDYNGKQLTKLQTHQLCVIVCDAYTLFADRLKTPAGIHPATHPEYLDRSAWEDGKLNTLRGGSFQIQAFHQCGNTHYYAGYLLDWKFEIGETFRFEPPETPDAHSPTRLSHLLGILTELDRSSLDLFTRHLWIINRLDSDGAMRLDHPSIIASAAEAKPGSETQTITHTSAMAYALAEVNKAMQHFDRSSIKYNIYVNNAVNIMLQTFAGTNWRDLARKRNYLFCDETKLNLFYYLYNYCYINPFLLQVIPVHDLVTLIRLYTVEESYIAIEAWERKHVQWDNAIASHLQGVTGETNPASDRAFPPPPPVTPPSPTFSLNVKNSPPTANVKTTDSSETVIPIANPLPPHP